MSDTMGIFIGLSPPCFLSVLKADETIEMRIHRNNDYLKAEFLKFICPITETNDLWEAHTGEVKSVK